MEGRLAGIVETEEDDGVFYMPEDAALEAGWIQRETWWEVRRAKQAMMNQPSLLVASI